jgi:tetraacyldisaccharide-1-P 4'-kinase
VRHTRQVGDDPRLIARTLEQRTDAERVKRIIAALRLRRDAKILQRRAQIDTAASICHRLIT